MSLVARLFVIFFSWCWQSLRLAWRWPLASWCQDFVTVTTDPVKHFTFFAVQFFATGFVGFVAFVPAAVLIAIAETFDIRSIFYYTIAGAAIGLFTCYGSDLSAALENTTDLPPVSFGLQLVAASGIIGGFVYWIFAGRKAGFWKNPLATV